MKRMGEKRKNNPNWEPVKKNGRVVGYRKKRAIVNETAVQGSVGDLTRGSEHEDTDFVNLDFKDRTNKALDSLYKEQMWYTYPRDKNLIQTAKMGKTAFTAEAERAINDNMDADEPVFSRNVMASCHTAVAVDDWSEQYLSDDRNTIIDVKPFDNNREYGLMYRLRDAENNISGSWHGVYEHRNSDDLIVNSSPFGETVDYGPYGKHGDSKYDYGERFKYGDYQGVSGGLLRALEDDYEHIAKLAQKGRSE